MPAATVYSERQLTIKQERFAQIYCSLDPEEAASATSAYKHAYAIGNMAEKTIQDEARRLLKNPRIAARIQEIESDRLEAARVSPEWIKARLVRWADSVEASGGAVKSAELLGKALGPEHGGSMFIDRQIETIIDRPDMDIVPAIVMLGEGTNTDTAKLFEQAARLIAQAMGQDYDAVMAKFYESHGAP